MISIPEAVIALILATFFCLSYFPRCRPEVYRLYRMTGHGRFESWRRSF